ncbi:MAG: hypothetical protein N2746_09535 [Deltaproteobacteria bacterium]|nr:hypothetical protein [Deltaproteobacteria bacterium]
MEYLTSTNGLVIFLAGLVHLIYLFFSGSKSVLRYLDLVAIVFGVALWRYPEKIQAIVKIILHSQQ